MWSEMVFERVNRGIGRNFRLLELKLREPDKRERTPAYVHLIVEMYVKHAYNLLLTLKLRDYILEMLSHIKPIH